MPKPQLAMMMVGALLGTTISAAGSADCSDGACANTAQLHTSMSMLQYNLTMRAKQEADRHSVQSASKRVRTRGLYGIVIPDGASDDIYTEMDPPVAVLPYDANNRHRFGECAATVVHARYAVTAAHCFSDVNGDKSKAKVRFNISGKRVTSSGVLFDPCWNFADDGPNSHDLALIKFDTDLGITPVPIHRAGVEEGKQFTLMGWGDTGTSAKKEKDIEPCTEVGDCKFRVAENIFESAEKGLLKYRFDDPSNGGLPKEGLAYTGDSGGPAFLGTELAREIAGVNSGGDCCGYGSVDMYCRLADKTAWLDSAMSTGTAPAIDDCDHWPIKIRDDGDGDDDDDDDDDADDDDDDDDDDDYEDDDDYGDDDDDDNEDDDDYGDDDHPVAGVSLIRTNSVSA